MPINASLTGSYPPVHSPYRQIHRLPPEEQDPLVWASIERAIADQLEAGMDILVDGQPRADIVPLFSHKLPGFDPASEGPCVISKIRPADDPITMADYLYARKLCPGKPLKAHLTGPLTISRGIDVDTNAYTGIDDPALLTDLADALADEAGALVAAGAEIIQIDEPVLQDGFDLDFEFSLLQRIVERAAIPFPALHSCGDVTLILEDILERAPVRMVSIEGSWLDKPSLFDINQALLEKTGKLIGLGCFSSTDNAPVNPEWLRRYLGSMVRRLGAEHIWAAMPNCGLRFTEYALARQNLRGLAQAAHQA